MKVENHSGWKAQGKAVLLRAIELEQVQAKTGGSRIVVPDEVKMSSAALDIMGVVVEIGPDAWKGERETPRAKVGDVVLFTKYAGGTIKGTDGYIYRFIADHAIYATKQG